MLLVLWKFHTLYFDLIQPLLPQFLLDQPFIPYPPSFVSLGFKSHLVYPVLDISWICDHRLEHVLWTRGHTFGKKKTSNSGSYQLPITNSSAGSWISWPQSLSVLGFCLAQACIGSVHGVPVAGSCSYPWTLVLTVFPWPSEGLYVYHLLKTGASLRRLERCTDPWVSQ